MKQSCNVLNVKSKMQEEAYQKHGRRDVSLRVGKDAIREEMSFLSSIIEVHMNIAGRHCLSQGRRTIMEEDIIVANGVNLQKEVSV